MYLLRWDLRTLGFKEAMCRVFYRLEWPEFGLVSISNLRCGREVVRVTKRGSRGGGGERMVARTMFTLNVHPRNPAGAISHHDD